MQRLQDIGVPEAIRWGIYALYESVTGRVRAPGGLSDAIESTIGVKQGCPLSPILFGIYIDELLEYVDTYGDAGSSLARVMIPLLLYADDVVLISDFPEGLQRQLDALQRFCADRDLTLNLGKTKVMVFNTTQAWVTRAEHQFTFRGEMVEQVRSYVYLGVTFTGPRFSLKQAADARLDRGFAALGRLERQCAHVQFQEPRTMRVIAGELGAKITDEGHGQEAQGVSVRQFSSPSPNLRTMDGYKEEGSSSQDRQSNPTVHEVGEGSSQAEEGFPHAAFSITGTASPGTLFGGMQSMVPNPMYANIGLHPGFQGTQGQFGVSQGNWGMAGFSIPPVNMAPRHQHVTDQGVQMAPTAVWMSDAFGIVPNCQNSILEWFRAQNRMDGYKEEGSSSQDRQCNPTVHEVGEGSSQAEEGFPHAAFSITGTASPGTLFGGMQSMVPNPMYANIGLHPGFQGTQGQFGVSQGNLGMAGFSIPPVNMAPRHQHVTDQGVQMAPTGAQEVPACQESTSCGNCPKATYKAASRHRTSQL
ncbi:hypothetical protein L7F22_060301 [Adiantum nelumboides]|nr:hypothetical protein [Adiantum nelumboides]